MTTPLGLVTVFVRDMQRMKEFYTEMLGFKVVPQLSSPTNDFLLLHTKKGGANLALQDVSRGTYGVPLSWVTERAWDADHASSASDPFRSSTVAHSVAASERRSQLSFNNMPQEQHGGVILGFIVEDADAVYQDWQTKSTDIVSEIIDIGAGHMFMARDPEGNYIQVYHLYPQVLQMQTQLGLL